ncbi:MAG: uracil-DNA glycosylase [Oscillospiraceae bacterium]|nr:uracil-DNA glycosylase [Oscillospiraceae bacterium]
MVLIGNRWDELLAKEWDKEYYQKLRKILKFDYFHTKVYPNMHDIFNALKYVDYDDCKVVIIGQDPYHGEGQAHGLSFSVKPPVQPPPSLQNIFREISEDLKKPYVVDNGDLTRWAKQGVLLLNAVLTVKAGQANSHANIGWQYLTDEIITLLNKREKPMVFLLWGAYAGKKQELITNQKHLVLRAPHPSPLSASRGFFGCRHFSKTNEFLEKTGQTPIDW